MFTIPISTRVASFQLNKVGLRGLHYQKSSQPAIHQASYHHFLNEKRNFCSKLSEKPRNFKNLNNEINEAVLIFNEFIKLNESEKILLIIEKLVDRIFITIHLDQFCTYTFSEKWSILQDILKKQGEKTSGFPTLPDFNFKQILSDNTSLDILLALQKNLLCYQDNMVLTNQTEEFWSSEHPTIPFTGSGHESVLAIEQLILPALVNGMIIREMGCWNGETLIRLAFAASKINIFVEGLFGVDLNPKALQIGATLLHHLNIQNISLGVGNVLDESFFSKTSSDNQQMILGFRLVPTLSRNAIDLLFLNLHKYTKKGDLLCFSYALPSGKNYEKSLKCLKIVEAHKALESLIDKEASKVLKTTKILKALETARSSILIKTVQSDAALKAIESVEDLENKDNLSASEVLNILENVASKNIRKETHQEAKGLTIYLNDSIDQTYISQQTYTEILNRHNFKELETKEIDDRIVSLFLRC
ncbi:MAG: hypothetical protein H0V82_13255 [Candidatus Protochlamydia sp.]|nr:hypothetical protein [Candidatus Protochlamydia sp.]